MARVLNFGTRQRMVQIYVGQNDEAYHGLVESDGAIRVGHVQPEPYIRCPC